VQFLEIQRGFLLLSSYHSFGLYTSQPAFIPQTPFCGRNPNPKSRQILKTLVSVLRKSKSPENSFGKIESELKPHALPEYLEGRTPKEKHPFLFQKKFHPRQIRNARSVFSFGVAGVLASAWGFLRAYDSIQSHHALRAWHITDFGNRFESYSAHQKKRHF
jgi:hypothetical protein